MTTEKSLKQDQTIDTSMSRRSMMAASGAAVAAGLAATPSLQAGGRKDAEIDYWTAMIGNNFNSSAELMDEQEVRGGHATLRLVDVIPMTADDPARPREMRKSFSLIFEKQNQQAPFQSAIYSVKSRKSGTHRMFLHDVMDMDRGEMVVEAVFG